MSSLQHTPLYDLHIECSAKMVDFAGFALPLQYGQGIIHEHQHTRSAAGLFDISHMGQISLQGMQALELIDRLVPSDILSLQPGQQKYTVLTNEQGGIIDDLVVTRWDDHLQLVVNAVCRNKVLQWLQNSANGYETRIEIQDEYALLALQGPMANGIMQSLAPETQKLVFMQACQTSIDEIPCAVSRSGYTGEDGFEISVHKDQAEQLARLLLSCNDVEPVGLGARDTLRLEAGLCLYGQELDETMNPLMAGLQWLVKPGKDYYPGARYLMDVPSKQRVGLLVTGRVPVRPGTLLTDRDGNEAGLVTSGSFGPTVGQPVAMAYLNKDQAGIGNELQARVRNRTISVTVVRLPFVPHRYHR